MLLSASQPATETAQSHPDSRLSNVAHLTHINFFNNGSQIRQGRLGVRPRDQKITAFFVAILVGAFGCIHLLSCDAPFPSAFDGHFWPASTVFIAGLGVVYFLALRVRANRIIQCIGTVLWISHGAARIMMMLLVCQEFEQYPNSRVPYNSVDCVHSTRLITIQLCTAMRHLVELVCSIGSSSSSCLQYINMCRVYG